MDSRIVSLLVVVGIIGAVFYIFNFGITGSTVTQSQAPELAGIAGYINTDPITLADFDDNVVLVDFWTYSCINCIRTIPYLNDWYRKYSDDGFVIIGVHTPEFEFEKNRDNVQMAVERYGIMYPVVQDNDYSTWRAYGNNYWPRKYLIDIDGNIRYDHIGEGAYEETEMKIRELLEERAQRLGIETGEFGEVTEEKPRDLTMPVTPELYFGYQFARQNIGNPEGFSPGNVVNYTLPSTIFGNTIYLSGEWRNNPDHMELVSDGGSVALVYSGREVNIVAGGASSTVTSLNGTVPAAEYRGLDVSDTGITMISDETLYNLISSDTYHTGVLQIDATKSFRIYTFTFG